MGRRPKQLDMTLNHAEEFLHLAKTVQRQEAKCLMVKYAAETNWWPEGQPEVVVWECVMEYMDSVQELVKAVVVVVHNPLFWSEQIPLPFRSGFAALLDSPVKTEVDDGGQ